MRFRVGFRAGASMAATLCSEPCAERGAGPCAQAGRVSVARPVVGLVRCAFILLAGEAMALNVLRLCVVGDF